MTYEQRRTQLAEKMARKFDSGLNFRNEATKLLTIHRMLPLAELALADMAVSVKNVMIYVYTSDAIERHLIDNGLVPQKQENEPANN